MSTRVNIVVEPALADYLAERLRSDEEFLIERQAALQANNKEENATWQYLQGKRDMCKQFLLYLEEIQHVPKTELKQQKTEVSGSKVKKSARLFNYPDDYDMNE